jgi:hypothetical protein
MKSAAENKPARIVKGNIFDVLGFSSSEASALKIKAELLSAILEHVKAKGYTQAQLADILDEYQPSVSNPRQNLPGQHRETVALCRPPSSPNQHRGTSNGRPQPHRTRSGNIPRSPCNAQVDSGGLERLTGSSRLVGASCGDLVRM